MSDRVSRCAALCVLAAVLSGCGGLKSDAPREQIYVLQPAVPAIPPPTATPAAAPVRGVLSVQRPLVQPGLETSRIALTRPGNRLDFFADSRWGAQLPTVVDAFATQSLLASGQFEMVAGSARGGGGAYFQLLLTVRHFEAQYEDETDAAPTARVTFECVLTSGTPRRALGRCDAESLVPAGSNRMGAIVQALESAAQQAMSRVVEQAATLAAASPAPPPAVPAAAAPAAARTSP